MQTTTDRPAQSLDSLSKNLARQQRRRETALQRLRRLRNEARDEIERLLAFLDASDLDPDLESTGDDEPDGCDEPSLGSLTSSAGGGNQNRWGLTTTIDPDMEDEHDGAEPDEADYEPSIGFDSCTIIPEMDEVRP